MYSINKMWVHMQFQTDIIALEDLEEYNLFRKQFD